eukprot:TRINITY_DN59970_c0_g1_i1.p1 TRINITY_DN59970_c0_g1~~TRINITY_DN59970_c0_g1_i1.p1  ORF type:complete len:393 (-),score=55.57 TRINITY_DN59970_c0_g1_i1:158-1168(-)
MKIIDIAGMSKKQRNEAINEVKVLSYLRHPYIISYRESFIEDQKLYIIMDYAEGGDLYTKIQSQKKTGKYFNEAQILRWFTQAALSLKYMHDRYILHRDLKTQNFFVTASGRLRVGDFGISKMLESTSDFTKTIIGTPYYLSPEICKEQPYSWASDIWALGCVLYEMAALRVPFEASNLKALVDKITKGPPPQLPAHFSPALKTLVAELLERDPKKRPNTAQLLDKATIQDEIRRMLKEEYAKKEKSKAEGGGGGGSGLVSRSNSQASSRASTPDKIAKSAEKKTPPTSSQAYHRQASPLGLRPKARRESSSSNDQIPRPTSEKRIASAGANRQRA